MNDIKSYLIDMAASLNDNAEKANDSLCNDGWYEGFLTGLSYSKHISELEYDELFGWTKSRPITDSMYK